MNKIKRFMMRRRIDRYFKKTSREEIHREVELIRSSSIPNEDHFPERRQRPFGRYWDRSEPFTWGNIKVRIGDFDTKTISVTHDNEPLE